MKKILLTLGVFAIGATAALAASTLITYTTKSGDTLQSVAAANGTSTAALVAMNPSIQLQRGQTLNVGIKTVTPPPVVPPVVIPPPVAGETRLLAYTTGYGYPDNTPQNSADICCSVLHAQAGGTGTYADPITIAVGHSKVGGKDILDYAAGTRIYIPNVEAYFIVEDACGDGPTPQNVACHNLNQQGNAAPAGAQVWVDMWVGGVGQVSGPTVACEDTLTGNGTADLHTIIINPASNYKVVVGQLFNGSCRQQFGNAPVTQ